jgi:hypothetical protein
METLAKTKSQRMVVPKDPTRGSTRISLTITKRASTIVATRAPKVQKKGTAKVFSLFLAKTGATSPAPLVGPTNIKTK